MEKVSGVFKRSEEEECRHYVRIFDESLSKNAYKWSLSKNSSGDKSMPNSPVLDSKDTKTSQQGLIEQLERLKAPDFNSLRIE